MQDDDDIAPPEPSIDDYYDPVAQRIVAFTILLRAGRDIADAEVIEEWRKAVKTARLAIGRIPTAELSSLPGGRPS